MNIAHNLKLRPATQEDAEMLLQWRNDISTRMASHSTDEVTLEKHIKWLNDVIQNQNRSLYVAEKNGVAVGSVRADYEGGTYELSWTVSPEARGQGVGKRMVRLLANRIKQPIRAEVKKGNQSSSKIAEYSGMKFENEDSFGILHYRRNGIA